MKLGQEVVVVDNQSLHDFEVGEIVKRVPSQHDTEDKLCFYSELNGSWHMLPEDYKILDEVVVDVQNEQTETAIELLRRAKMYVGRVSTVGACKLADEISNFLRDK